METSQRTYRFGGRSSRTPYFVRFKMLGNNKWLVLSSIMIDSGIMIEGVTVLIHHN